MSAKISDCGQYRYTLTRGDAPPQVTDAMVEAALCAKVANGEDVFWNMVFGIGRCADFERREIAEEIVRTILKAAHAARGG